MQEYSKEVTAKHRKNAENTGSYQANRAHELLECVSQQRKCTFIQVHAYKYTLTSTLIVILLIFQYNVIA